MFQKSTEMNKITHVGLEVNSDRSQMIQVGEGSLRVFSPSLSLSLVAFSGMYSTVPVQLSFVIEYLETYSVYTT